MDAEPPNLELGRAMTERFAPLVPIECDAIYAAECCPVCAKFAARHPTGVCEWCAPLVVAKSRRATELIDEYERTYPGYRAWLRWAESTLPGRR